jgi:hypothetical protein
MALSHNNKDQQSGDLKSGSITNIASDAGKLALGAAVFAGAAAIMGRRIKNKNSGQKQPESNKPRSVSPDKVYSSQMRKPQKQESSSRPGFYWKNVGTKDGRPGFWVKKPE